MYVWDADAQDFVIGHWAHVIEDGQEEGDPITATIDPHLRAQLPPTVNVNGGWAVELRRGDPEDPDADDELIVTRVSKQASVLVGNSMTLGRLAVGTEPDPSHIVDVGQPPGDPDPVTGIQVNTNGAYGIRLQGVNTVAAIGLNSGQRIAFEGTGAITVGHEGSPNRIVMYSSGGVGRVQFEVSTTPSLTIGTTQVLGTRKTGWTVPAGTANRNAFNTTTVTTELLAERVKALIEDLHNTAGHGLIGT